MPISTNNFSLRERETMRTASLFVSKTTALDGGIVSEISSDYTSKHKMELRIAKVVIIGP